MTQKLWFPSRERIEGTLLKRFMNGICKLHGKFEDYDQLWQWSVDEIENFWRAVWTFCGVVGEPSHEILRNRNDLFNAEFFPEAKLNYAQNLLHGKNVEPALIFRHESGKRQEISWQVLCEQVSRLQQALRAHGIQKGDRIAGYLPNIPEAIVAMLAATSLGAVWSSCSPDFGVNGLKDRFGQIAPRILFTADGYTYNGRFFDSLGIAAELSSLIPSIEKIVVIPFVSEMPRIDILDKKMTLLADLCSPYTAKPLHYQQVGFRDPLFILFSSGTTGLPKCFVHSVGGTLLHHLKEHQLQCDIKPGDRLFYFTTCGWAMWNWQVSALASGATLVLYEGSPSYPGVYHLADVVAKEKVTHFGTSAKYIDSCAKQNVVPIETHDFSCLRTILSTGSPLSADGFRYVYRAWKSDICLSSISGGTDIIGCFVGGNPIGPVYAGQCQKRHLGMDVQVFDDDGNSVEGVPGELVCLSPHPGMPLGFLNDPGRKRYFNAYFSKFPNAWCHSDWVELTPEHGMIFYGRSDATLNPGGVRIGTAEIYRQIESIDEILESVAIGQEWDNDVRVVLFVKLREGAALTDELVCRIRDEIRSNASPRHVPAKILAVPDIPRTHSGKISELAVRDVVHGREVKNMESLSNPEALQYFRNIELLMK